MTQPSVGLRRVVSLPGAILLGLGSMIGTGVFVSLGLAAEPAGGWLPLAVLLAALLALTNALNSAQLAANQPVSGGAYEYGHLLLNPFLGFVAGWFFLVAKSASAAAACIAIGKLLAGLFRLDGDWIYAAAFGLAALGVAVAIVSLGVKKTNLVNAAIVAIAIFALVAFVVFSLTTDPAPAPIGGDAFALPNFFYAVALIFVAFTGYGRLATMGEEVKEPRTTIPKAIVLTMVVTTLLYVSVAWSGQRLAGSIVYTELALEGAPLAAIASDRGATLLSGVLVAAGLVALFSVVLNLLLGLSRVAVAMARRGELPVKIAVIRKGVPRPAIFAVGSAIAALVLLIDLSSTWALSAFTVLLYYGISNLAATQLTTEERLYPGFIPWAGVVSCFAMAFVLPLSIVAIGVGLLIAGLILRFLLLENASA